jgi:ABC-type Zn uptake system ZnuABC Zn-binding protein ZnuA
MKIKMKVIINIIFTFFFVISIANAQTKVIATTTITADIAKNIVGDKFEIIHIVPVGGDPHLYEPVPQDAQLVAKADLILVNGLTLEGWLTEFIDNSGTKAKTVIVSEGVKPVKSEKYNSPDPHAWMTAANGIIYARNIMKAFVEYAPENKMEFEANFAKYKRQLEQLEILIFQEIEKIPEKQRVLITSHDAFQYFGRHYGIRLESILGTSTDAEAQTADVMRVQKVIKETGVPAVFIESTINPKLLQQIATDNNVEIGGELFSDSLGELGGNGETYLEMLKHNAVTISYALKGDGTEEELAQRGIANGDTNEKVAMAKESNRMNWGLVAVIAVFLLGGFGFMYKKMNN